MSPKEFREFLHETKTAINGINKAWLVVDDSQLGNTLEQSLQSDNAYMVGVLPSYGSKGRSIDAVQGTMVSQIFIVEKTDYSDLTDDDFIDVFERTYQLAIAVRDRLVEVLASGCYAGNGNLDLDNLEIVPVWKKSQCNGWSIYFNLE